MHILFLTDNFPPEVNAPASRTFEHAREWVKAGHQVTVVTTAPNFPKGKVLEGYRNKLWQAGWMDGIRVVRVWTYIAANEGFARRVLDYLSFMASGTVASLFIAKVDLVVGTSPQFFTACAAYLVSRVKGIPFVFELRDIWPESIKAVGAMGDSMVIRILERIEMFLYRKAKVIISVTHSFKRSLAARGVSADKIHVITNGVDLSRFAPGPKNQALAEELGIAGAFVGGYIGTHGLAHGLETLLDAAEILQMEGRTDIRLVLLGDGACKAQLKADAGRRGLGNVVFVDTVPKDQVVAYWSLLDVSIIHLKDAALFASVIPSKMFEAMAMGLPLVHGVRGESAELVVQEGVGVVFPSGDGRALRDALVLMKDDPDAYQAARQHCLAAAPRYDRACLAASMLQVLERALDRERPVPGRMRHSDGRS